MTKAQRKAVARKQANQLRKELNRYRASAGYFDKIQALKAEGTPEARKLVKKLPTQYHGSRWPLPGDYFKPNGRGVTAQ